VVYRKYVYYLSDEEARNDFIKNPMHYIRQPPPKSLIPAKIAILGPPKSGKTTGLFIFYIDKKKKNHFL
jgi:adenylate/nucleoside-diphosphate kinase